MAPLPGILGHERSLGLLEAAVAGGRVHHAYLFAGPGGVGKELVARRFAQALLCEAEPDGRPCLACAACQKVEHQSHPDVVWALPQAEAVARGLLSRADLEKAPSRDLRVAEVRELERRVRLPPYEGRHKVVILTPADRMNQSAQNALLKTLEEPPGATTLILVTAAADALLPTVRSRCVRIPFGPLPVDLVAEAVAERRGIDRETARIHATLAGGSLGGALALDPEAVADRRALVDALRGLDPADGVALTAFAEGFTGDREAADERLGLMSLWYRDVLAAASGAPRDALVNVDRVAEAEADAARLTPREVVRRLDAIATARRDVAGNVNARLVVEGLLAGFEGAG
jgi:DNA polymerase III subunit delta'